MRLTKTTGHAIRILIDCAGSESERVKVASIASRLGISQLNAFKIVHILAKSGFLDAMRGRNGGVKLAMSPHLIRIGAIVREIEATDVGVAGANGAKRREKAPINAIFDDALEAFIGVLDRHTLADMAPVVKRGKKRGVVAAPAKSSGSKPIVLKAAKDARGKAGKSGKPVKKVQPQRRGPQRTRARS